MRGWVLTILLLLLRHAHARGADGVRVYRDLLHSGLLRADPTYRQQCLAPLEEADANKDGLIDSSEYLQFAQLIGLPTDFTSLPLNLRSKFNLLACLCHERQGFDDTFDCCNGANGSVDLSLVEEDPVYLHYVCSLTSAGVDAFVTPAPTPFATPPPALPTRVPVTQAPVTAAPVTAAPTTPAPGVPSASPSGRERIEIETTILIALRETTDFDVSYRQEIVQGLNLLQLQQRRLMRALQQNSELNAAQIIDEAETTCPATRETTDQCFKVKVRLSLPANILDMRGRLDAAIDDDGDLQRFVNEINPQSRLTILGTVEEAPVTLAPTTSAPTTSAPTTSAPSYSPSGRERIEIETTILIALRETAGLDVSYRQEIVQGLNLLQLQQRRLMRALQQNSELNAAEIIDEAETACPATRETTDQCLEVQVRLSLPANIPDLRGRLDAAIDDDGDLQRFVNQINLQSRLTILGTVEEAPVTTAPTTPVPTTPAPTTSAPTTPVPTTSVPTTSAPSSSPSGRERIEIETTILIALRETTDFDVSYRQEIVQGLNLLQLQQRRLIRALQRNSELNASQIIDETETTCPATRETSDQCFEVQVRLSLPANIPDLRGRLDAAIDDDGGLQRLVNEINPQSRLTILGTVEEPTSLPPSPPSVAPETTTPEEPSIGGGEGDSGSFSSVAIAGLVVLGAAAFALAAGYAFYKLRQHHEAQDLAGSGGGKDGNDYVDQPHGESLREKSNRFFDNIGRVKSNRFVDNIGRVKQRSPKGPSEGYGNPLMQPIAEQQIYPTSFGDESPSPSNNHVAIGIGAAAVAEIVAVALRNKEFSDDSSSDHSSDQSVTREMENQLDFNESGTASDQSENIMDSSEKWVQASETAQFNPTADPSDVGVAMTLAAANASPRRQLSVVSSGSSTDTSSDEESISDDESTSSSGSSSSSSTEELATGITNYDPRTAETAIASAAMVGALVRVPVSDDYDPSSDADSNGSESDDATGNGVEVSAKTAQTADLDPNTVSVDMTAAYDSDESLSVDSRPKLSSNEDQDVEGLAVASSAIADATLAMVASIDDDSFNNPFSSVSNENSSASDGSVEDIPAATLNRHLDATRTAPFTSTTTTDVGENLSIASTEDIPRPTTNHDSNANKVAGVVLGSAAIVGTVTVLASAGDDDLSRDRGSSSDYSSDTNDSRPLSGVVVSSTGVVGDLPPVDSMTDDSDSSESDSEFVRVPFPRNDSISDYDNRQLEFARAPPPKWDSISDLQTRQEPACAAPLPARDSISDLQTRQAPLPAHSSKPLGLSPLSPLSPLKENEDFEKSAEPACATPLPARDSISDLQTRQTPLPAHSSKPLGLSPLSPLSPLEENEEFGKSAELALAPLPDQDYVSSLQTRQSPSSASGSAASRQSLSSASGSAASRQSPSSASGSAASDGFRFSRKFSPTKALIDEHEELPHESREIGSARSYSSSTPEGDSSKSSSKRLSAVSSSMRSMSVSRRKTLSDPKTVQTYEKNDLRMSMPAPALDEYLTPYMTPLSEKLGNDDATQSSHESSYFDSVASKTSNPDVKEHVVVEDAEKIEMKTERRPNQAAEDMWGAIAEAAGANKEETPQWAIVESLGRLSMADRSGELIFPPGTVSSSSSSESETADDASSLSSTSSASPPRRKSAISFRGAVMEDTSSDDDDYLFDETFA